MIKLDLDIKNDVVVDGKRYLLSTKNKLLCDYEYETILIDYASGYQLYCKGYNVAEDAIQHHCELSEQLKRGEKIWTE